MTKRTTRKIRINPEVLILKAVGVMGVAPHDPPSVDEGWELVGIRAKDDVVTFTYEKD